ncbi:DNA polymerase IV [Mangrovimicrobium sediminis]|uniref:DNA polymerase IV n=1 Tax=Mangrovimicrobium sediminis TaxID=2562682 RepID=A0A4Z0M5F6_9GAMM|nr:DNA polymerase IV [Haliea sp. SAOS-164]TGD74608.1 DNA polymerase IV [Haliea sp. SAOS-164]
MSNGGAGPSRLYRLRALPTIGAMPEPDSHSAPRKIIHIDMDAFFASVEQRDNPELRGRPVAVGGSAARGVVAAASYEARAFGVRSAMPSVTAKRRCPELLFVKPRFEVYRAVSQQIHAIFARYTPLIEPLSLDEAYLDVSADLRGVGSATRIAQLIRAQIREETGLTASAGVSYNKFIAKIASDQNKPDGICVVRPEQGAAFVAGLPARRFYGVGPKTAEKMAGLGIHTGADLRECELAFLVEHFGKSAQYLYHASRGVDHRAVKPDRTRKSIGAERTYGEDLQAEDALRAALDGIVDILWARVEKQASRGRTVTLKLKYNDFRQITRARSLDAPVTSREQLAAIGQQLLGDQLPVERGVRLLGLAVSSLDSGDEVATPAAAIAEPAPRQGRFEF